MKPKKQNIIFGILFICVCIIFMKSNKLNAIKEKQIYGKGCKTEYYLIKELFDVYNKQIRIKFRMLSIGNKREVSLMLDNMINIAFTCKHIDKLSETLNLNKNRISKWISVPITKDPIILVSNRENGIKNLSKSQVINVFQGSIKNWKEIGGNDLPVKITHIDPVVSSGMLFYLRNLLWELTENSLKDQEK